MYNKYKYPFYNQMTILCNPHPRGTSEWFNHCLNHPYTWEFLREYFYEEIYKINNKKYYKE